MPSGTRSAAERRVSAALMPRSGSGTMLGSSWSRLGESASGGSHTWRAGGPAPGQPVRPGPPAGSRRSRSRRPARPTASCAAWGSAPAALSQRHGWRCCVPNGDDLLRAGGCLRRDARRRLRRGARDVGGLEPGQVGGVDLQVAVARLRTAARRRWADADDAAGLHRGEGAQRDPVRQVALDAVDAALVQTLRGQQQVHAEAERPSRPMETNRSMNSGLLASSSENSSTTISSDGNGVSGAPAAPGLLVVEQRGVAALPQELLPARHLAVERVLHAVDEVELVGQVGDHRGGVRQPVHAEEGRAALEVHQHEVEDLRGVRRREPA